MEDYELRLKQRLESFGMDENLPSWVNDKILKPSELENYKFYELLPETYPPKKAIDPRKIIGTTHVSYNGRRWIEMLKWLKRNHSLVEKEDIENFVLNEKIDEIENKSVIKYGDYYFIYGGGNHRLCFAKFLGLESVLCDITEHHFDYESYDLYNELISLNLKPEIGNTRDNWTLQLHNLKIFITSLSHLVSFVLYYKSIKIKWKDTFLRKLFLARNLIDKEDSCCFRDNEESKKEIKDYLICMEVFNCNTKKH